MTVLVSDYIVSEYDYYKAQVSSLAHTRTHSYTLTHTQDCYKKLYEGGMEGRVQYAYSKFEFSHEKYWIIDSTTVHLSTGIYTHTLTAISDILL